MKRVYTVLSVLLLSFVFGVGLFALCDKDRTFSASENRALAERPKLKWTALLDGSFAENYMTYFADTFPGRETLMKSNRSLNSFYYYSGFASDDDVALSVGFNSGAANGGEALKPNHTEPSDEEPSGEEPSGEAPSSEVTEPSESEEPEPLETQEEIPEIQDPGIAAEDLGQAILVGNRAMDVPYANFAVIEAYAKAVTGIADALGADVRTFSMAVPNASAFYTPEQYRTGNNDQRNMIDYCYSKLGANVISVETYANLAKHMDEYIYFRTDHHWTQLGAYYAYEKFCEAAGFQAEPLSKFEAGQYDNFVGSMYTYLSNYPQAQILVNEPDTLYFYRPFVEAKARYYSDATLTDEGIIGVISYIESSVSNKYLTYCGGDHPVVIIRTNVEGPVCMLLKESYGNAMIPWLTSHYSKIVVVDPREFNRDGKPGLDLAAFAEQQGVNDCLILNYPMMINSESYVQWLERLVD